MNYPLISEYIEAIRSAEDNFDKLTNLRPMLDDNGNPIMSSGNFAVVFKMKDIETDRVYAVKCFTREQEERGERYQEIIKVLDKINSPFFVSTRYYDKELFVVTSQGKETEFPVLLMDWVEGMPLDEYMKTIEGSQFKRELLAKQFQRLVCWLLPQHFAHGDLKPENIMVKEDYSIVLLDYDGMYVPSLRGKEALEVGTPFYRHTGRNTSFFNEYIDDYSAVLLLLLLKINSIIAIDFGVFISTNSSELLKDFEDYLNNQTIAPLMSAFIMVSTFGRLDRQLVSGLLSDNSDFDYNKESVLQDSARKGDALAMYELGRLYARGMYVPQDNPKALQWFLLSKLLGNVDAQCELCKSIFYNHDFGYNNEDIFECLKKCRVGFAYCHEGERLYSSKEYKQAFSRFKTAADMGTVPAERVLGLCYENGWGVEKDIDKAILWFQKAADDGNFNAQRSIGLLYKNGIGFQKDFRKAVDFFKKAAEAGVTDAQCNIAFCYINGEGIAKDASKAVYWWQKAAESGSAIAQMNLATCFFKGEGVDQDFKKAAYWWQKAAEGGNAEALYSLSSCYADGKGVVKDVRKAVYFLEKAARNGSLKAMRILAICYFNGTGTQESIEKSAYWLKNASKERTDNTLTSSQVLQNYKFISAFTVEQFKL